MFYKDRKPRPEQHCFAHYIPIEIGDNKELALKYLLDKKVDLKYGDLVINGKESPYRNKGVNIFNGQEIVDLYYEIDDYGSLPPEFHVIEEGFAIDYWQDKGDLVGIKHNNIVWFDHTIVRDQCIRNIKYNGELATTFLYNHKRYKIIFEDISDIQETIAVVKKAFLSSDLIIFNILGNQEQVSDNHTLFVIME